MSSRAGNIYFFLNASVSEEIGALKDDISGEAVDPAVAGLLFLQGDMWVARFPP